MLMPFINVHTHIKSGVGIELINSELYSFINEKAFSVGIHPMNLCGIDEKKALKYVKETIKKTNCLAIGEVGIDRRLKNLSEQIDIFTNMVCLSEENDKPLILHCVKSWFDLLAIRKKTKTNKIWIFHGFNGNLIIAKKLIEKGCYLSFGKALLNSKKVQNVFKQVPINKVFFETDNDNINIEQIYKKASLLKSTEIENLKRQVYFNFINVFKTKWKIIGYQEPNFCWEQKS